MEKIFNKRLTSQWEKSPKQQSEGVRFLIIIRHSKYSAMLSKAHSFRPLSAILPTDL